MIIENFVLSKELKENMDGFYFDFEIFLEKSLKNAKNDTLNNPKNDADFYTNLYTNAAKNINCLKQKKEKIQNFSCVLCRNIDEIALANAIGFEYALLDENQNWQKDKTTQKLIISQIAEYFLYDIRILKSQNAFNSAEIYELGLDGVNLN